jgi:hypothetical protein
MGTLPTAAPQSTFRLTQGADNYDLDLRGKASKNGAAFGTWTTNKQNQIAVKGSDGTTVTFTVDWAFNDKNQLTVAPAGGAVLFTFAPATGQRPSFETVNAVLKVKPNKPDAFAFELRPEWGMDTNHNLTVKVGSKSSLIDGFVADPLGRFLYTFADKLNALVTNVLGFAGGWQASDDGTAKAIFVFTKEDGTTGTFAFPQSLAVRTSTNQFSYSYTKNNRSFSVQLQGMLFVDPDFRITYVISRQLASNGTELVKSTTLAFAAEISRPNFQGDLTVQLKKADGQGTTLTIGGHFSGQRGKTGIQVGFSYSQTFGVGNTLTRSIGFDGAITFAGGQAFWNFSLSGQTVTLAIGVDVKVGKFSGDLTTQVTLENGQLASVTVLLGFRF